jgi:hypothetical protein
VSVSMSRDVGGNFLAQLEISNSVCFWKGEKGNCRFSRGLQTRVARFFLVHDTKTVKNNQTSTKMYQTGTKCTKLAKNVPK